jgi:hypothetical protein
MTNPNADLDALVSEPRETLDVEVKDWLDRRRAPNRTEIRRRTGLLDVYISYDINIRAAQAGDIPGGFA